MDELRLQTQSQHRAPVTYLTELLLTDHLTDHLTGGQFTVHLTYLLNSFLVFYVFGCRPNEVLFRGVTVVGVLSTTSGERSVHRDPRGPSEPKDRSG